MQAQITPATITVHGVTLSRVWFDHKTFSVTLGFCTDPGVREMRAKFATDGADVKTVDGYVVVFVSFEA